MDRPRGDADVWIKIRFGKDGPREVEVVGRSVGGREEEGEDKGGGKSEDGNEDRSEDGSARTTEETAKL